MTDKLTKPASTPSRTAIAFPKFRKLLQDDYTRMGLPKSLQDSRLDRIHESLRPSITRYISGIDGYVRKPVGFLVYSQSRNGKSSLVSVLAKAARARTPIGFSVFFQTIYDLRESMRSKSRFDEEMSVWERCLDVDVLILDNWRPEDAKDTYTFTFRHMHTLVTQRAANGRVTYLTARASSEDISSYFSSLLSEVEMNFQRLELPGEISIDAEVNRVREELAIPKPVQKHKNLAPELERYMGPTSKEGKHGS